MEFMEQLLTEAANCIPAIQHKQQSDLEIGLLPYSPDIPLDILFDFVNEMQGDLLYIRKLLLRKTAHIKMNGLQQSPKALELEIADALKRLRYQNATLVHKRNLLAAEQDAQVGIAPFYVDGHGLVATGDAMFSPLLTLESMGYGWKSGPQHDLPQHIAINQPRVKELRTVGTTRARSSIPRS